ncbi:gap junction Cx32.2 protein-like [Poecilia formosa]|uniref:gap junction Cx32.2 protein-like n=1 Tax=Poecilia formosa TaxID=48698 RepID=UPI0007BA46F1|nr:PREDICTED: gap junction Cx32.2 protein-like [Poecilia formosa]
MTGSGDFGVVSKLLKNARKHSTSVGKVWVSVLFVFRIFVLMVAAKEVWQDEQSNFLCDTNQPGCQLGCYDKTFPVSHVRFWIMQIIFVSTPTLVYLGFVVHKTRTDKKKKNRTTKDQNHQTSIENSKEETATENQSNTETTTTEKQSNTETRTTENQSNTETTTTEKQSNTETRTTENQSNTETTTTEKQSNTETRTTENQSNTETRTTKDKNDQTSNKDSDIEPEVPLKGPAWKMYIVNVVSKILLEIAFFVAQYCLYGFGLESMYTCEQWPCLTKVFCYVSRPTEKTIFIIFMLLVALISLLLNVLELAYIFWKKYKKRPVSKAVQCNLDHDSSEINLLDYKLSEKDLPFRKSRSFNNTSYV